MNMLNTDNFSFCSVKIKMNILCLNFKNQKSIIIRISFVLSINEKNKFDIDI